MTIAFTLFFFCWLSSYTLEYCDKELIYYLEDVQDDEFKRMTDQFGSSNASIDIEGERSSFTNHKY